MPRRRVEKDHSRPSRFCQPVRGEVVVKAPAAALTVKKFFGEFFGLSFRDVIVSRAIRNDLRLPPVINLQRSIDADLSACMGTDRGTSWNRVEFRTSRMSCSRPVSACKLAIRKLHGGMHLCQAIEFWKFPKALTKAS